MHNQTNPPATATTDTQISANDINISIIDRPPEVSDHVDDQLYFVSAGKKVDYTQLFDKHLLEATTPLEHHYVLKRVLDHLVACGEIDVVFAGEDDEGQTLYQRMD